MVEGGLTTHSSAEVRINKVLLHRASEVVVVADFAEIGRETLLRLYRSPLRAL